LTGRRQFLAALIPPARPEFRRRFCQIAEEIAWMPREQRPRQITDCSSYVRYCYQQAAGERGNSFGIGSGKRAEFADAEHLMRYNSTFISHEWTSAQPADVLFFRQLEPRQPWHAMIFLGSSLVQPEDRRKYLAYHTGPDGRDPGEIRRPAVEELLRHPEPRWRPLPGNRNFLGVFRWNILS
jgi:uncharacterized protein YfaT (DUF1175 family)